MQSSINYEKYSNMSERQLLNALLLTEKSVTKLKADFNAKLKNKSELIKFLKAKLKEKIDKPKYYTLDTAPAIKEIDERLKKEPQLAEQLKRELDEELFGQCK